MNDRWNKSWKTKFFTIAIGQMVSLVGSSAVQFALIWWIASETGSAIMMGLSGMVAFLPMTVLSPVAGIVADKYHRKYVCIVADLLLGVTAAIFAVLLWMYDMPVWTALVILFFRSVNGTFHQPALQALMPQIVPAEYLVQVGGWNQMMMSGSFLLGPAVGAALYAAFPLPIVLLTDLLGALIASAMLALVHVPRVEVTIHENQGMVAQLKDGFQVYQEDKRLLLIMIMETLCMIFYLPLSSFYPLMTSSYFQGTAWHASAVEAIYALGMMITAALFGSVIKVKRHLIVSYLGMLGLGATSLICGLLPPTAWGWWVFAIVCGFMGGFGNVYSIPLVAYMQTNIAPEKMGRAFALFGLAASLSMPIGLLVGSPVAEFLGVHVWFFLSGVGVLILTVVGMAVDSILRKKQA